jgi:hypothetical protein
MSSQKKRCRTGRREHYLRSNVDRLGTHLVSSVVVTVGGVYQLTGSPLVSLVTGGVVAMVVTVASSHGMEI